MNSSTTRVLDYICLSLVILGAVNWGLIGLFRFDVIAVIFGGMEGIISRIIYVVIALAGLYCLSFFGREYTRNHRVNVTSDL
ncbi:MAG: DUF378 domain-containing protein [Defluviitaleaceae bacterium]|nr:DUF378 domain-containing protein [Defluviitaleaceae bacterium]